MTDAILDPMQQAVPAIIGLAQKHIGNGAPMQTSAMLSLDDARQCNERGDYWYAAKRALDSLGFSVGILHADHALAKGIYDTALAAAKKFCTRYLTMGERRVLRRVNAGLGLEPRDVLAADVLVVAGYLTAKRNLTKVGKVAAASIGTL